MKDDVARLTALVAFLPELKSPSFTPGRIEEARQLNDDLVSMPYAALSSTSRRFEKMLYDYDWVTDLDWGSWAQTAEATRLRDDPDCLAEADLAQITHLLTTLARANRFSDGTLLGAFRSNLVLRIVERADGLLRQVRSDKLAVEPTLSPGDQILEQFNLHGVIRLCDGEISIEIATPMPKGNSLYGLRQDGRWLYFGSAKKGVGGRITSYVRHQRAILAERAEALPVKKRRAMHGLLADYLERGDVEILVMPLALDQVQKHGEYPIHVRLGLEHGLICTIKPPLNADTIRREC